ncbi:hypothetical protein BDV40DRAFT_65505 [Aspergillus tamarii]|uniref:Apple domain-containing protein n=1 Tax=Aspergillus tamarii TaxID=41984 RepID=A0A5N6V360_ASPTM|nr:hypothetical protein BDV40DRAFT_65505 [Aspergillus tamarii]
MPHSVGMSSGPLSLLNFLYHSTLLNPIMFLFKAVSLLLAVEAAAATSPPCTGSVLNDTISFFSQAPLTFSYEVNITSLCAARCARLPNCHAWLYSASGRECQLYRQQPVSQSYNPQFVSGICGEPTEPLSYRIAPSSSHTPPPLVSSSLGFPRMNLDGLDSKSVMKRDTPPRHHHTHRRHYHGH